MFSQVCTKNAVHRGVYPSMHWGRHPPQTYTSPGQTPQPDTPLGRHPWQTPPTVADGRYASYLNAFLLVLILIWQEDILSSIVSRRNISCCQRQRGSFCFRLRPLCPMRLVSEERSFTINAEWTIEQTAEHNKPGRDAINKYFLV